MTRLSRASICPACAWRGVIWIVLWYVWLYSHVVWMIVPAWNSVPSLAKYNIHLIFSFKVMWVCSTIPFYDDASKSMVFNSYPWEFTIYLTLYEANSLPLPSVVVVMSPWPGRRFWMTSVYCLMLISWTLYLTRFTGGSKVFDSVRYSLLLVVVIAFDGSVYLIPCRLRNWSIY